MFDFFKKNNIDSSIDKILQGKFNEVIEDENIQKDLKSIVKLAKVKSDNKEEVKEILRSIFSLAGSISNFNLKLIYQVKKIKEDTSVLREISQNLSNNFQDISKTQDEMVGASTDISTYLQDISEKILTIEKNTVDNSEKIIHIENEIKEIYQEAKQMQSNVNSLVDTSKQVMSALTGIAQIAKQTNLLALNASIEAERSGDAGKGFAVVAQEIRKLSNNTEELLKSITNFVVNMKQFSEKSQASVELTTKSIGSIEEEIQEINKTVLNIKSNIIEISQNVSQIASHSEEFSASTQQVTNTIHEVTQIAENVTLSASNLDYVNKELLDLSYVIKEVEENVINLTNASGKLANNPFYNLENNDFINIFDKALKAHTKWMGNLEKMVNEMKILPIQTDDKKCQFGHFYHNLNPTHEDILQLWSQINGIHLNVHKSGKNTIDAIERKDEEKAVYYLNEAKKYSSQLFNIFYSLIEKAEELTKKSECIFCKVNN